MPSPFPGMDPYIESSGRWADFHTSLLIAIRAELNIRLPEGYAASAELYVWLHEPEAAERVRVVVPDVYVTEDRSPSRPKGRRGPIAAAPRQVVLPGIERRRRRWIEITDLEAKRVVTAIEVLSPANKKAGDHREVYLTKRSEYFAAKVNLVEIDLLRGGRRLPLGGRMPADSDYYALACRSWEWPRADFWPFGLRDPLPEVPIPLVPGAAEVRLPLRPCVDRAYDEGRYSDRNALPYDEPLTPRPRTDDVAWVNEVLRSRSRRRRKSTKD